MAETACRNGHAVPVERYSSRRCAIDKRPQTPINQKKEATAGKAASPTAAVGDEELEIKLVLRSRIDVDAAHRKYLFSGSRIECIILRVTFDEANRSLRLSSQEHRSPLLIQRCFEFKHVASIAMRRDIDSATDARSGVIEAASSE